MRLLAKWWMRRTTIEPLDLARDGHDVDALLADARSPLLLSDLEGSQVQPGAVALVARTNGHLAGFCAAHAFGDVACLDAMVVAPAFRRQGVARALSMEAFEALRGRGARGFVLHATPDQPALERLGFTRSGTYTWLRRDPREGGPAADDGAEWLGPADREAMVALDAAAFGRKRARWIDALVRHGRARFLGRRADERIAAMLAIRPRRHGVFGVEMVAGADYGARDALLDAALRRFEANRLECFARTGSRLEARLRAAGFVPAAGLPASTLVEWRRGRTDGVGDAAHLSCLGWL